MGTNFYSPDTIDPFNGITVYGIGLTADIELYSDTSYIRIIAGNGSGYEYIVFESYPMIDTIWNFQITHESYETSFLDAFQPTELIIQMNHAAIYLDTIDIATQFVQDASELQMEGKIEHEQDIVDKLNAFIENNDMIWVAGPTQYAFMYYYQKKQMFGPEYRPIGFEYYTGGIFEVFGSELIHEEPTYDVVQSFDWRNRHGATDINNSFGYYSDDVNGWFTDIKCQAGCWVDPDWVCVQEPWDPQTYCESDPPEGLGGEWRQTYLCPFFSTIGAIEGLVNIYYNDHIDYDLSEQQFAATPTAGDCWNYIDGGHVEDAVSLIKNYGVVTEDCFSFEGSVLPCDLCAQNQERVYIDDYEEHSNPTLQTTDMKRDLIENGPQIWERIYFDFYKHAMSLVGYSVIHEGDEIYGYEPFPAGHSHIGKTYWIFRDSNGPWRGINGYILCFLNDDPEYLFNIYRPFSWEYNLSQDRCRDEDEDGYCNWGLGPKPANCSLCTHEEMDGNDSDYSIGPIDENGFTTIINTYNMSFENGFGSWRQSGNDDKDLHIHSGEFINWAWWGPDGAQDGDRYLYFNSMENCQLEVDAFLESPLINFDVECSYNISFYYYISRKGDQEDGRFLELQTSSDNGETWYTSWQAPKEITEEWQQVSLQVLSGVNRIRFHVQSGDYEGYSDMGIDNITITEEGSSITTIVGDHIIDYDFYACGDIVIEPASSLTIKENGTVFMLPSTRIIVKRTGLLHVEGGLITCSEQENFWEGAEVWGENGQGSNQGYQGVVKMNFGGTISLANCAIQTIRSQDGESGYLPDYSGGLVYCDSAFFINNKMAIELFAFEGNYDRKCKRTYFELNDGDIFSQQFFKAVSNDGIQFKQCSFSDYRTGIEDYERCNGIYAINSIIYIDGIEVNPNPTPGEDEIWRCSKFNDLKYGIYLSGIHSGKLSWIKHSLFDNTQRGIFASGMDQLVVKDCDFKVLPYGPAQYKCYGLYMEECSAYTIEENYFHNDDQENEGIGLIVYNSGEDPNEIYRNRFEGLEYCILAQDNNRGAIDGLQIKCNDFIDQTDYDIVVSVSDPGPYMGIALNQGTPLSTEPEAMAGNLFFLNGIPNDVDDIENDGTHVNYYHSSDPIPECINAIPVDFSNTTLQEIHIEDWDYNEACPPHDEGNNSDSLSVSLYLSDLRIEVDTLDQKIDSTRNLLNDLVDGGDTEILKSDVDNSIPPESMAIYNELMGESPYLSDTVVESAILKEDVLPNAMIRDVMTANTHSSKSEEVLDVLEGRNPPVPDYMMSQILAGQEDVSAKEQLESKLAYYKGRRARAMNSLLRYYWNDTLNPQASSDSIIFLLTSDNHLSSKYKLAFYQISIGDSLQASGVINAIPSQFNLSFDEMAKYQHMLDYFNWLSGLPCHGNDIAYLDSLQIAQLWDLNDDENRKVRVYTRNILLANDETTYEEPVYLPDFLKGEEYRTYTNREKSDELIKVFPNPAKDYFIVQYRHQEVFDVYLKVFNPTGYTILDKKLLSQEDQIVIDSRDYSPGVYIAGLFLDGKCFANVKFTVIK